MVENYEYFYTGTKYSLEPTYGNVFTGYRSPAAYIGGTTSVQTANQLKEVSNLLNTGMKVIEVSQIQPEVFESIPKQHLEEVNRLSKLTGAQVSVHAPIVEPSGFTQQGWSEQNRFQAETQMKDTVLRSHAMNPDGVMPVTFHASAIPGTETVPVHLIKDIQPDEIQIAEKLGGVPTTLVAVNRETGEFVPLRREKQVHPATGESVWTAEKRLEALNHTQWLKDIRNIAFYKKESDEVLGNVQAQLHPFLEKIQKGNLTKEEYYELYSRYQPQLSQIRRVDLFLDNVDNSFRELYEKAAKYGNDETKEVCRDISKEWQEHLDERRKGMDPAQAVIRRSHLLDYSMDKLQAVTNQTEEPQVFIPIEQFAIEKAGDTFSNVALEAYKKYGEKAPIISIENPPYGTALSTGHELKKLIEATRDKFVEKAVKQGMGRGEAQNAAKKLIGATWDTSHISMMRKMGYDEKALIEESRQIAPFVKHVHLNDNFGHTHTDLPPGMGNVPIKEILEEFERKGVKANKIVEGGNFFQHFQMGPHSIALEAMGSPLYSMVAQPGWNQVSQIYGNYFTGYGRVMPEQHFNLYGGGWTTLPVELGGQVQGAQSRFSGTPTE
ncbi:MAG: TIM barrel protein [archaeon]